eukprot:7241022-Pyramimonas_sp.AAC.1
MGSLSKIRNTAVDPCQRLTCENIRNALREIVGPASKPNVRDLQRANVSLTGASAGGGACWTESWG